MHATMLLSVGTDHNFLADGYTQDRPAYNHFGL